MLHSRTKTVNGYGKRKNNVVNVHDDFNKALLSPIANREKQPAPSTYSPKGDASDEDPHSKREPPPDLRGKIDVTSPPKIKRKALSVVPAKANGNGLAKRAEDGLLEALLSAKTTGKSKASSSDLPIILSTPSKPTSTLARKPLNKRPPIPLANSPKPRPRGSRPKPAIASLPLGSRTKPQSGAGRRSGMRDVVAPNSASSISSLGSYHTASSQLSNALEGDENIEEMITVAASKNGSSLGARGYNSRSDGPVMGEVSAPKAPAEGRSRVQGKKGEAESEEADLADDLASMTMQDQEQTVHEPEQDLKTARARRPVRSRAAAPIIEISSSEEEDDKIGDGDQDEEETYTPPSRQTSVDIAEDADLAEQEEEQPMPRQIRKGKRRVIESARMSHDTTGKISNHATGSSAVPADADVFDPMEGKSEGGSSSPTASAEDVTLDPPTSDVLNQEATAMSDLDALLGLCEIRAPQPFEHFVANHPFAALHAPSHPPFLTSSTPVPFEARLAAWTTSVDAPRVGGVKGKGGKEKANAKGESSSNATRYKKIGEASFSEVYGLWDGRSSELSACEIVMKVIPLRNSPTASQPSKGAEDKHGKQMGGRRSAPAKEVMDEEIALSEVQDVKREIEITKMMSEMHEGFISFLGAYIVDGRYPQLLLHEWDKYDDEVGSESVRPDNLPQDQLYAIILLANGGADLETFSFSSTTGWQQALSVISQVTEALVAAEAAGRFEHRDLHEGQVLVKVQNGTIVTTVIDFGLSRVDSPTSDEVYFSVIPEEVFAGEGKQWDVYRRLKQLIMANGGNWSDYHPFSNVMWLQYLTETILNETPSLRKPKSRATAKILARRDKSRSPIKKKLGNQRSKNDVAVQNERCHETLLRLQEVLAESVQVVLAGASVEAKKRKLAKAADVAKAQGPAILGVDGALAWLTEAQA